LSGQFNVRRIPLRPREYPHPTVQRDLLKEIYRMKALPWVIAGVGVGIAAYVVLNQPGPQYATGNDDVEYAAGRTTFWGSKQRLSGAGGNLAGKLKEGIGRATGNDQLADQGVADQVVGAVKDTAGLAAQAAGQAIHELNR
jgi:uncharacterized protein YjbJ (UPF0337 family)